jgi:hypothetical protein
MKKKKIKNMGPSIMELAEWNVGACCDEASLKGLSVERKRKPFDDLENVCNIGGIFILSKCVIACMRIGDLNYST